MKNRLWPEGTTKLVSSEAIAAIARSRGFRWLTPDERLRAAQYYDATRGETPRGAAPCTWSK